MTAQTHPADWKVTTAHRVLARIGWSATVIAVYLTAVAFILRATEVWWMVAAFAATGLFVGVFLPEPVPRGSHDRRSAMIGPARPQSTSGRG